MNAARKATCFTASIRVGGRRRALERLKEGLREPRDTLTHILMLAEHSRRNGLLGLGDVETNWAPLQRVCSLVASAADEQRIRSEAAASIDAARQRSNLVILPWLFLGLAALCTGGLGSVLIGFSGALSGSDVVLSHVFAPLLVAFALLALVVVPVSCRLIMAREREISCIQLAYEGALKILNNNNVDAVFHALAALVPGAPATVVVSEIGDLDTGRGPWL